MLACRTIVLALVVFVLGPAILGAQQQGAPVAPAAPAVAATGRITGRVLDRETGRPLQGVRVMIVGVPGVVESDLDGRYRTPPVGTGLHSVRAAYIGYKPSQRDSITVLSGQAVTVDFALSVQAIELEELSVESVVPPAPKTDAGLLAAQQAAPSASDGISAEAISRNPDATGGDVIRRVTGITVFDKKFVVVRGLNERYSNTLLNGVDLPSPEPLKKVVPLDIFPANLLESIVTTKSATPDKPGDFAGGSVEIRTKEFPENPVMQVSISQGFNSQSTFRVFAQGPRTFGDALGFGANRRRPSTAVTSGQPLDERAMESFRNVWRGTPERANPNLGFAVNVGGQFFETRPLGYVLALTYSAKRTFTPGRLNAFYASPSPVADKALLTDESATSVEWGAIGNLSWRVGASKFGFKNLYTRSAEETLANGYGALSDNDRQFRYYGVSYIERDLLQSQLSGEHQVGFLFRSRFEWKGTYAKAIRDEPDNRQAKYSGIGPNASLNESVAPSEFTVRKLNDRILSGQGDLAIPLRLRRTGDSQLKIGGLYRDKVRNFSATGLRVGLAPTPEAAAAAVLPPEEAFAPENMGRSLFLQQSSAVQTQSYDAQEHLTAAYGMLDVPVLSSVRLVGGVRMEDWRMYVNTRANANGQSDLVRLNRDYLWSANMTIALSEAMNLRFAGFRSVTRPDPRDLSLDQYTPVGSDCSVGGDTSVVRAKITNADARWEYYPRAGEIFAVSGFYKKFDHPLVEKVTGNGGSGCVALPANGTAGRSFGLELEARRNLDFLPGFLKYLSVGLNGTILGSSVELDPLLFGVRKKSLDLQGQSPLLVNASLSYVQPATRTSLALLFNYFDDRIARYGGATSTTTAPPDVIEKGRFSLDAKAQQTIGGLRVAIGATNLTHEKPRYILEGTNLITRTAPIGTTWSVGFSYDIY